MSSVNIVDNLGSNMDNRYMVAEDIIGTITSDGCVVVSVKPHLFDRMDERGVTVDGIMDALQNPLHITDVRYNPRGEPSVQYIGRQATVAYNPDTRTVVSDWPTSHERRRRYGIEE